MYKKLFAIVMLFGFSAANTFAQETKIAENKKSTISKPSRDFLMLQLTYDGWANKPDSVKTTGFGRGFNIYLCYDWPLTNANFSFAAGIGMGNSNIYFKDQELITADTGSLAAQIRFVDETKSYSKYKLSTTYIEAPFELRFFSNKENRNKGFKAALGMRVGMLVGAHTKGNLTVDGNKVIEKVSTTRYLDSWRFSATMRLGYGNYALMGSYNLNSVFKDGNGPNVTPYSIGICITGL